MKFLTTFKMFKTFKCRYTMRHLILGTGVICLSLWFIVFEKLEGQFRKRYTLQNGADRYRTFIDALRMQPVALPHNTTIYFIMPTFNRLIQRSLLTMQFQTLYQVPNLHLIIAEDAKKTDDRIDAMLKPFKMNYTHLACSSVSFCQRINCTSKKFNARGSVPRNCALTWLQQAQKFEGVIYFGDDDNFYDLQLFNELRKTRRVALFPVGGFSHTWMSSPLIQNGTIKDFYDPWKAKRKWPIDMAGFAVSLRFWTEKGYPKFIYKRGHLETKFVESLNITRKDVDVLADGATKVYVWHNSIRKSDCLKKKYYLRNEKYPNFKELKRELRLC